MTILHTYDLQIKAGSQVLIDQLNWQVERGQFWCVLGKNGSGKTTLLHVLAGLSSPDQGKLCIADKDINRIDIQSLAQYRSLMQQQQVDSFSHSVLDTVLIGRIPYRLGTAWDADDDIILAHTALAKVGLSDKAEADVKQLSGGERQRVALAAQLLQEADVMLLDEPVSHQDVAHQLTVMRLLNEVKNKSAVIATCHDMQLARRFATHALILGEKKHWQGIAQDVLIPEICEQAFGCRFSLLNAVLAAE